MAEPGQTERSPRFSHWAAFVVFSTITLGSVIEVVRKNNEYDYNNRSKSAERWAIACSSITFIITTVVFVMHLHPVSSLLIVNTHIEGALCLLLVGFWIGAVSVITDATKGLAVDQEGNVSNGNLYYFGWAGFVCSIALLVSYLRGVFQIDIAGEIRSRSARLNIWSGTLAASLVVMGACANYYDNTCGGDDDDLNKLCGRTVYGIVLGALGTFFSVIVVGIKIATSKAPFLIEVGLSLVLVIMYGIGVGLLTSENGPGHGLGNIYYFSWIGFVTTFMLVASCFEDYNTARTMTAEDEGVANEAGVPVDAIDERI